MTLIRFRAIPTDNARFIWDNKRDDYGNEPETLVSDGDGIPCRHCLQMIHKGETFFVLAYRPFSTLQPYAETGPIFLHQEPCQRYEAEEILPPILESPNYIIRGYDTNDRIVYGTGNVIQRDHICDYAINILARHDVSYAHVRSAQNNCYQCRIDTIG